MSSLYLTAAPVAANVSAAAGYEIGTGRLVPTVAALVGLSGAIVGGWVLVRSRRAGAGAGTRGAVVALLAGVVSVAVSGLHLGNVAGGPGTGNGYAGAVIGIGLGLAGIVLGALVLARSRRSGTAAYEPNASPGSRP